MSSARASPRSNETLMRNYIPKRAKAANSPGGLRRSRLAPEPSALVHDTEIESLACYRGLFHVERVIRRS
jgi:hypothetical protein